MGSLPKIVNSFLHSLLLVLVHLDNLILFKGSLHHSLTGWYVLHY